MHDVGRQLRERPIEPNRAEQIPDAATTDLLAPMESVHDGRLDARASERLRPFHERRVTSEQRLGIHEIVVVREPDLGNHHLAVNSLGAMPRHPTAELAASAELLWATRNRSTRRTRGIVVGIRIARTRAETAARGSAFSACSAVGPPLRL